MVGAVGVGVGELVLDAMGLDDVADVVSSARAVDSGRAGGKCSRRVQVCVVATLLWW